MSCFEIYNEAIVDLSDPTRNKLAIRQRAPSLDHPGFDGLSSHKVASDDDWNFFWASVGTVHRMFNAENGAVVPLIP